MLYKGDTVPGLYYTMTLANQGFGNCRHQGVTYTDAALMYTTFSVENGEEGMGNKIPLPKQLDVKKNGQVSVSPKDG